MSRRPAVVAELGRPETPDETATRKAKARAERRANQTFLNLILSLAASLAIVVVIVLAVLRPDPPTPEPLDVAALAAEASGPLDAELLAPDVPQGWRANAAELRTGSADIVAWYVGYVTADDAFASVTQALDADATWLANTLRDAVPTGEQTIDGVAWQVYDQRGEDVGNLEYAMSTVVDDETVVLAGTAEDAEFQQLAEAVSAQLAP